MTEIDVSGCRYYRKNKECDIWGIPCQMKEFCYYKMLKQENAKLKEALEKINSIIDNDFTNSYMELSFNEYDDILEKIGKACEVLKDE